MVTPSITKAKGASPPLTCGIPRTVIKFKPIDCEELNFKLGTSVENELISVIPAFSIPSAFKAVTDSAVVCIDSVRFLDFPMIPAKPCTVTPVSDTALSANSISN